MSDCVLWEGYVNPKGYGTSHGKMVHRRAYEREHGSLGSLTIHHACGVKTCVNTDHMVPMARGAHTSLHKKGRRTGVCAICGTPHSYVSTTGEAYCRPCQTKRQRRYRAAKNTGSWLI